jgi:uncharacterized protein YjbI with pentapeptide repeats
LFIADSRKERIMAIMEITDKNLAGQQLQGLNLCGKIVKRVSFDGANLSRADLSYGQFFDCSFVGSDFGGAHLTRALFENCNFRSAKFVKTTASEAVFRTTTVLSYKKRSLLEVSAPQVSFDGATIEGSDFTNANLNRASLTKVKANDVNFSGADLRGAVFEQCSIAGAQFAQAKLEGADFSQTEDASKALPEWAAGMVKMIRKIAPADLMGMIQRHQRWVGSNGVEGARLTLLGHDLTGIEIARQDLSGADLRNCRLDFADLSGAKLVASDLRGASLIKTDLRNADLRAALISETALSKARAEGARRA